MAVPLTATVGLVSNPDVLPTNGSATLATPANWQDSNNRNVTVSISGRTARVYSRDPNPYKVGAGN
jgi:hypothetical protein